LFLKEKGRYFFNKQTKYKRAAEFEFRGSFGLLAREGVIWALLF